MRLAALLLFVAPLVSTGAAWAQCTFTKTVDGDVGQSPSMPLDQCNALLLRNQQTCEALRGNCSFTPCVCSQAADESAPDDDAEARVRADRRRREERRNDDRRRAAADEERRERKREAERRARGEDEQERARRQAEFARRRDEASRNLRGVSAGGPSLRGAGDDQPRLRDALQRPCRGERLTRGPRVGYGGCIVMGEWIPRDGMLSLPLRNRCQDPIRATVCVGASPRAPVDAIPGCGSDEIVVGSANATLPRLGFPPCVRDSTP